eukprot:COSAG04_NODE_34_length_34523_cov_40.302446_29_plen_589_part_00
MVRKPVLNVIGMLAKLGTSRVAVGGLEDPDLAMLGGIATRDASSAAVLLYSSQDSQAAPPDARTAVSLTLANLPPTMAAGKGAAAALFLLDDAHGNALAAWEAQGRPLFPSAADFAQMRAASEIAMAPGYPKPLDRLRHAADDGPSAATASIAMRTPAVALLHVCAQQGTPPPPVNVSVHVTPTPGTVLVKWQDSSRCVATFIIERSTEKDGTYQRVNGVDTVWLSFIHASGPAARGPGCYRVRTKDYWGAVSAPSPAACTPAAAAPAPKWRLEAQATSTQLATNLPATCQEVLYRDPSSQDGDYILQCSPADTAFDVFCAGMNGTDGGPREYLTLPAGTDLNFAEYLCGEECQAANPGDSTVRSVFAKIRINPCTLFVDIQDYTFASSTGRVTHVDSGNGAVTIYTEQPFGTAGSCEGGSGSGPGGEGGAVGKGNVDVRGTPFTINTTWVPHGAQAFGSSKRVGDGQKSVGISGGGYCGLCEYSNGLSPRRLTQTVLQQTSRRAGMNTTTPRASPRCSSTRRAGLHLRHPLRLPRRATARTCRGGGRTAAAARTWRQSRRRAATSRRRTSRRAIGAARTASSLTAGT